MPPPDSSAATEPRMWRTAYVGQQCFSSRFDNARLRLIRDSQREDFLLEVGKQGRIRTLVERGSGDEVLRVLDHVRVDPARRLHALRGAQASFRHQLVEH